MNWQEEMTSGEQTGCLMDFGYKWDGHGETMVIKPKQVNSRNGIWPNMKSLPQSSSLAYKPWTVQANVETQSLSVGSVRPPHHVFCSSLSAFVGTHCANRADLAKSSCKCLSDLCVIFLLTSSLYVQSPDLRLALHSQPCNSADYEPLSALTVIFLSAFHWPSLAWHGCFRPQASQCYKKKNIFNLVFIQTV